MNFPCNSSLNHAFAVFSVFNMFNNYCCIYIM